MQPLVEFLAVEGGTRNTAQLGLAPSYGRNDSEFVPLWEVRRALRYDQSFTLLCRVQAANTLVRVQLSELRNSTSCVHDRISLACVFALHKLAQHKSDPAVQELLQNAAKEEAQSAFAGLRKNPRIAIVSHSFVGRTIAERADKEERLTMLGSLALQMRVLERVVFLDILFPGKSLEQRIDRFLTYVELLGLEWQNGPNATSQLSISVDYMYKMLGKKTSEVRFLQSLDLAN